MPILHHERIRAPDATPERRLYVLHGIFGMGRNWATVARRVVRSRPEWEAVLVDLRQHGASRGFPPPHTVEAAAADLEALAAGGAGGPAAVLGHSFGGKVALAFARARGGGAGPEQVWVVDSTPEPRPPGGGAWQMLALLRRLPGEFGSRGDAVSALEKAGVGTPVAQWMATNLAPSDGAYRWRFDLEAMEALLLDFFRTDLRPVVEEPPAGVRLHFVKAEGSDVLSEAAASEIEAAGRRNGRVFLHRVAGGHWLNADNPDAVVELLVSNL